ncbi:sulfate transport system ATP-binding protein [Methylophilaceae bacterium]|nr:sulfate transport system ATP-binding protein [Methylophilaceae bacterium]
MLLELDRITQAYDHNIVVDDLSIQLAKGQIGCLLGPSGCGKTTVLRLIAGFEKLLQGEIRLNGVVVANPGFSLPTEKRRIGMVFQDYALFPHLNVLENTAFGLHQLEKKARRARAMSLLDVVGLADAAGKYPHELSGGQQQRVAVARALAPTPDLLLLDEPFSNLDTDLRERLSREIRDVLKSQNATAIIVTHDQHEAFAMADEIGVMQNGSIQQWDSAYNLYHRPGNRFVADFVGKGVLLAARVSAANEVTTDLGIMKCILPPGTGIDEKVDILLRPDDIVHDDNSPLQAEIVSKAFQGAEILYTLRLASGQQALSLVPSHHNHAIGEKIGIRLEIDHVVAFR